MIAFVCSAVLACTERGLFFCRKPLEGLYDGDPVAMVAASPTRSAAVTDSGELSIWGLLETTTALFTPAGSADARINREVFGNVRVRQVALGEAHTVVLLCNGHVYTHGRGAYGVLGHGTHDRVQVMQRVAAPAAFTAESVVFVATGLYSSFFVRAGGDLWSCGRNQHGELGVGHSASCLSPVPVPAFGDGSVAMVSAGLHAMAVMTDKSLFAWGMNCYGQLGTGDYEKRESPTAVEFSNVVTAATGELHTIVLNTAGQVYTCGGAIFSALGTTSHYTTCVKLTPVDGLSGVVNVAAGVHTGAAVTTLGELLVWGYSRENDYESWWPGYAPVSQSQVPVLYELPARVGRHGHSLPAPLAIAMAMGTHTRIGADCVFRDFPPELVQRVVEACERPAPADGFAGRRLLLHGAA